jgi:hypothetical protein
MKRGTSAGSAALLTMPGIVRAQTTKPTKRSVTSVWFLQYQSQIGSVGSSWPKSLPVFRLIKCTLVQALHVTASYSVSETSSFLSSSSEY